VKLVSAVRRSLRGLDELSPLDTGATELALTYAREFDGAAVIHASLIKVLREVEALDVDVHDRLLPLAVRVERITVLASLGPKLLTALESLGMTPRARAAVLRGVASDGDTPNPLADLRARRAARLDNAAAVDPAPGRPDP
jgi:hypothetical protein